MVGFSESPATPATLLRLSFPPLLHEQDILSLQESFHQQAAEGSLVCVMILGCGLLNTVCACMLAVTPPHMYMYGITGCSGSADPC